MGALLAATLLLLPLTFVACNDEDYADYDDMRPTALVTVRPQADKTFTLQLNDSVTLYPVNMRESPFGEKEVRALVNYHPEPFAYGTSNSVRINWMDSIRTKMPVQSVGEDNDKRFGNDPIEIVRDWVTIAEDGFLTLRIRTRWGSRTTHYINLLTGTNPDEPYTLELRHNACGDVKGEMGDALIAFNLNNLPHADGDSVKLKLAWTSFSGRKTAEFSLHLRPTIAIGAETFPLNARVK